MHAALGGSGSKRREGVKEVSVPAAFALGACAMFPGFHRAIRCIYTEVSMFDLLSTAELTASCAIVVFFLSSMLSNTPRQRGLAAAALAGWFCLVLAAGATGVLGRPIGPGVPGIGLAVLIPITLLSLLVLGTTRGRELVRRAPMPALVGVHSVRVLGLSFVLLYAAKRLPAPFAPVAGWGD